MIDGKAWMAEREVLPLRAVALDDDEMPVLAARLREVLLELDVAGVEPVGDDAAPEGAKGVAAVGGWLAVRLGPVALRRVIDLARRFAAQQDRTVEIRVSEHDVLKLTGVTSAQQDKIIDEWIARHSAGA